MFVFNLWLARRNCEVSNLGQFAMHLEYARYLFLLVFRLELVVEPFHFKYLWSKLCCAPFIFDRKTNGYVFNNGRVNRFGVADSLVVRKRYKIFLWKNVSRRSKAAPIKTDDFRENDDTTGMICSVQERQLPKIFVFPHWYLQLFSMKFFSIKLLSRVCPKPSKVNKKYHVFFCTQWPKAFRGFCKSLTFGRIKRMH